VLSEAASMDDKNMPTEISPEEQQELARKKRRYEIAVRFAGPLFAILFLGLLILDIWRAFFRGRL
jgi:hypothetical protein